MCEPDPKTYLQAMKDREELELARPLEWSFKLALLGFMLTSVGLAVRSGFSEALLWRSVGAMVLFGFVGYIGAKYLHRAAIQNVCRRLDPSPQESPPRVKTVELDGAQPGMVLAQPVAKDDGEELIPTGTELTDELLEVLREYKIASVVILDDNGDTAGREHEQERGDRSPDLEEGQTG